MNINTQIIVNADDFGMNRMVNEAILISFKQGLISASTIMINMPGFDEACSLIHENKLYNNIGIHFNLSEGEAITDKIKRYKKFTNNDGLMYKSFKGHYLSKDESNVVYNELHSQLKILLANGITPTHIDSHHHMHHSFGIGKIVVTIAKEFNIPSIRLRFNYGNLSKSRRLYSFLFNSMLTINRKTLVKYFCEIKTVDNNLLGKRGGIEIMVHPTIDETGILRNYYLGDNLLNLYNKYLPHRHFVNFKELQKTH